MTSGEPSTDQAFAEFVGRYEKWRQFYSCARKPAWDEPAWEGGRLNLRYGYPHMDWIGYIVAPKNDGYSVLRVTTERSPRPVESLTAHFSRIEDAGKCIIWYVGESLRMKCWLKPITRAWRAAGLSPQVEKVNISERTARYRLISHPDVYFEAYSGGIKPENRLLTLTYDELDAELLDGMPDSVRIS